MTEEPRVHVDIRLDADASRDALEADATKGLSSNPKSLPPVWFYDEVGSELFDEITRLPEYYQTRAERALLESHAAEIASTSKAVELVELGAGTCTKSRVLLDALEDAGTLRRYVAVDVAESTLVTATNSIALDYPDLEVHATIADFQLLDGLVGDDGATLVAFLGGTVGNLEPEERHRFFTSLDAGMTHGDSLLLGFDLVKDRSRLVAAYNDAAGVTARFNRNVLQVLNRELGANFEPEDFEHVARYDEAHQWIEMLLRSRRAERVEVPALHLELEFAEGEELRTEISAKFTINGMTEELDRGGFVVDRVFTDAGDFALALAHPYC